MRKKFIGNHFQKRRFRYSSDGAAPRDLHLVFCHYFVKLWGQKRRERREGGGKNEGGKYQETDTAGLVEKLSPPSFCGVSDRVTGRGERFKRRRPSLSKGGGCPVRQSVSSNYSKSPPFARQLAESQGFSPLPPKPINQPLT